MFATQLIARRARPAGGAANNCRRWMLGHVPLALAFAACADAPTAPSHAIAEEPRPSLGVTLVPSGYSVPQPLGFFPGGKSSHASGINNAGQIVGRGNRPVNGFLVDLFVEHAFLSSGGTFPKLQDLGTLPGDESSWAVDINDAGHVVGTSFGTKPGHFYFTTFRFSPGSGMVSIPDNPLTTSAGGINSTGTIVGWTGGGANQAFRWTLAGGVELLPEPKASASDINDAGVIVGFSAGTAHVWAGSSSFSLGTLGGSWSNATAINNSSPAWIVGSSMTANGHYHGFIWTLWFGLQDMGPFSADYMAEDVSDKGRVVGDDRVAGKAFTFYQGNFSYLPSLVAGGETVARAVNACGTIVGSAEDEAGRWVAVRWSRRTCDS
jgi:uncharacterized membrane protein